MVNGNYIINIKTNDAMTSQDDLAKQIWIVAKNSIINGMNSYTVQLKSRSTGTTQNDGYLSAAISDNASPGYGAIARVLYDDAALVPQQRWLIKKITSSGTANAYTMQHEPASPARVLTADKDTSSLSRTIAEPGGADAEWEFEKV